MTCIEELQELAAKGGCAPSCCGGEDICGDAPSDEVVSQAFIAQFTAGRHPAVRDAASFFSWAHLPEGPMREVSRAACQLAYTMIATLPDSPQLTIGLHELLAAKDAFVRAATLLDEPHGRD